MSQKQFWFGFLDAGAKSSPVLMDPSLETGNPETVYLYNLNRDEIIEYRRAIVDAKLRELEASESEAMQELKAGFGKARRDFQSRGNRVNGVLKKGGATAQAKPVALDSDDGDESAGYEGDYDSDSSDDDDWSDDD